VVTVPPNKRSDPKVTTPQGRSTSQVLARTTDRANIRQGRDPVLLSQAIGEFLGFTQAREEWWERVAESEWRAGYLFGVEVGRAQILDEEAAYRRATAALTRNASAGRPFSDLELLRWGPRGREHFADPRPGDYPGRGAA
jgi:hypothetical protein